ncbi:M48 family metallopeptidase [Motiliproteus sediminis]|uniref:M48 family metallopeptidase n=1 Tax=Motiliproteus sediminis TaxID=1468178 RepID=UPI001AEFE451|nr:M48 family metallopeptidase [Motiliproteus sediminis]
MFSLLKIPFFRFGSIVPLALLALLGGCSVMQDVDRGLYQLADQVSETDRVTGERSLSLASRSEQIATGNRVVEQLLAAEKEAGRPVDLALDRVQYQRLIRIFDRVHSVSHLRNERWNAVLIDRDSFNAFTTGGTYIVVHLGLMQQLSDDSEVAAVVAHEIAHTVANHVFEAQSLTQAATLANSGSVKRDGYRAAFTHENEREADRVGILYMALAGYDPMAASRIWQRQYQAEGNRRALFAHSHPVNSEREAETRAVGEKVTAYYQQGRINPEAAALLANNVLWQKRSSEGVAAAGEGGGLQALGSTLLGALVQHEQAKTEERRQQQHAAFVRYVQAQLNLVSDERPASDRWRLRFEYMGEVELASLSLGGQVKQTDGAPATLVAHIKGPIRRGQSFVIELRGDILKPLDNPRQQVQLYLDDALPVQ